MKAGFWTVVLVLIIFGQSFGQDSLQLSNRTMVGINAGVNLGSADLFHSFNGYLAQEGFRLGPQAGVSLITWLPNHVGLETGIFYIQKGWKQKFLGLAPDYELTLDYLELPFLANYYFGNKQLHFFVNAGCFFEYLVGDSQSNIPTNIDENGLLVAPNGLVVAQFTAYDSDRDNDYGYGLKAGGGLFYDFDFGTVMLQGTWSFSFSHVYDPGPLYSDIPNISNKYNLGIAVGYFMPLGPKANSDR